MGKFKIDFLEHYDDDAILKELRRVAAQTGKRTVSRKDLDTFGRVKSITVIKKFGSMRKALITAGLDSVRFNKATEEELIEILLELWLRTQRDHGRRPYRRDLKEYSYPVSSDTICRKFGSWKRALIRASQSADEPEGEPDTRADTISRQETDQPIQRSSLSVRKRFFVGKRAGWQCQLCGVSGSETKFEVDHVVPVAKGGSDSLSNLQWLCFECNRGKRDDLT